MVKKKRRPDKKGKVPVNANSENEEISASKRKKLYSSAILKIKNNQNAITKSIDKLQELSEDVDDFLTLESIDCLEKANKKCDQALALLEQSQMKWMGFNNLPGIPVRNILSYLSFEDKKNLRLSSWMFRDIVDDHDSQFQKFILNDSTDVYPRPDDYLNDQNFLQSNRPIKFQFWDEKLDENKEEILNTIFDRTIDIAADVTVFNHIVCAKNKRMDNIENMGVGCFYDHVNKLHISHQVVSTAQNLRCLEMHDVNLDQLKNDKFSLPCLKQLKLENVLGLGGISNLLSACSSTLEELCFRSMSNLDWTLVIPQDCNIEKLKLLRLEDCQEATGILALIRKVSSCLQDLQLVDVKEDHLEDAEVAEVLRINLAKLKSLTLTRSSSVLLIILKCPTPKLEEIKMKLMHVQALMTFDFDIESVVKLTLEFDFMDFMDYFDDVEGVHKLLSKTATNLEELRMNTIFSSLMLPKFPNLKTFWSSHCGITFISRVVHNAPCLKRLIHDNWNPLNSSGDYRVVIEELCLNLPSPGEFSLIKDNLAQYAHSLKSLKIRDAPIESWSTLGFNFESLVKMSLVRVKIPTGFEKLLEECHHTLQELEILGNCCLDMARFNFEMYKLKKLTIQCKRMLTDEEETGTRGADFDVVRIGSGAFTGIISACPALEILSLRLPDTFLVTELFCDYLELPSSLTTLQLFPKPSTRDLKYISKFVSRDLTYWFFEDPVWELEQR